MNRKRQVDQRTSQRKFISTSLLAVGLLALGNVTVAAEVMAPVVDAAHADNYISAMEGGKCDGCAEGCLDCCGCSGGLLSADVAAMGIGSCTDCDFGVPYWEGVCDSGCTSSCSGMSGLGGLFGGCAGGGFGGGGCKKCRFDIWGEYLLLRPRNSEVAYAVPVDGPIDAVQGNGVQIGRTGVVDADFNSGFRVGLSLFGPKCNGLTGQWTRFGTSSDDVTKATAPDVVRSLVTHPLGTNAASDGLTATANQDIEFDLVDIAFRLPWKRSCNWSAEFIGGARYGRLDQLFASDLDFNGTTTVNTDINFNGVGPRIGLLAQRRLGCCGYAYTQGDATFLVGQFDARYQQTNTFSGLLVDNSLESSRIVPQLDYELGIGLMTPKGRFRVRAGYLVSAWFNTVRTAEFINSVQTNMQDGLGDVVTFDGLTLRAELRF